jgi:hypothetical protein
MFEMQVSKISPTILILKGVDEPKNV